METIRFTKPDSAKATSKSEAKKDVRKQELEAVEARETENKKEQAVQQQAAITEELLRKHGGSSVKFLVQDPSSTSPNNVVIQVLNDEKEVIITIPSEEVIRMAKAFEKAVQESKGMLLNQTVA